MKSWVMNYFFKEEELGEKHFKIMHERNEGLV